MLKFSLFALIFVFQSHLIDALPKEKPKVKSCCLNHKEKPTSPFEVANYDCSTLNPFGRNRCNEVYGGEVCNWSGSNLCNMKKCARYSKFELHYGEYIDIGMCTGRCKADTDSCNPSMYSTAQIGDNSLQIIKECDCDSCGTTPVSTAIEIEVNKCKGNCNTDQQDQVCSAGVTDNFSTSNGLEPSQPSVAMVSGILAGCSAGIQSGFDIFADNRCFGHTFTNCFSQGECPLKAANLKICMRAADVSLTNTDSLVLGINGGGLWGRGLPALNGGTWNRNEEMCLDLNLANLPGTGDNILLDIQMSGHLDVMVQDDTAVDFLTLSVEYDNCQRCVPLTSSLSHLYTNNKVTDFLSTEDCDCVKVKECRRYDHFITYYEGTQFETTVNVGQCLGNCVNYLRCNAIYGKKLMKAPEGARTIEVVEKCDCGKLPWNPNGLYSSGKN